MRIYILVLVLIASAVITSAQTKDISKLTGIVYDPVGSVIVGAKVTAISADGKDSFIAKTDENGNYTLLLPYTPWNMKSGLAGDEKVYDITVESQGFQRTSIKEFVFIPSQFGQMRLDFGLRVGKIQD
jgi:hypothetical protein